MQEVEGKSIPSSFFFLLVTNNQHLIPAQKSP